ncbi:hypothetical protein Halha_1013 [Halobacteroides halobius DSM 5150]|uniref:Uncharacterized protein n=1 Tax=Halobacteroides halobius (strain ATCC 35273 / DSM 5150 / MD-1) TaxID=748449 RepID=L0K9E1_HALHC|nr:hypothetical protein [Halobacteroides halobius]AGB40974.1 hypothetical protein Halha_1013 [Halobacteroides halobius DSM 5150]
MENKQMIVDAWFINENDEIRRNYNKLPYLIEHKGYHFNNNQFKITKESDKAYQINNKFWIPKSTVSFEPNIKKENEDKIFIIKGKFIDRDNFHLTFILPLKAYMDKYRIESKYFKITYETEKAYKFNEKYWIPKTVVTIEEESQNN